MKIRQPQILTLAFGLVGLGLLILTSPYANADHDSIWPEISPFQTGRLKVSSIHEIYYEQCGNPQGKPVLVLHGGPGAQAIPYYRRFFNPEKFLIVLSDQRGCGRSRPLGEIRENTTQFLVEDIEKLRRHLELDKVILFGGSWGSTLGLAYAEAYPANVAAMVLRGIFTATAAELEHYYGSGVSTFFPEAHEKLESVVGGSLSPERIYKGILSGDDSRVRLSRAWAAYEMKIAELSVSDAEVRAFVKSPQFENLIYTLGLLENYYMANRCFLEEGQLLKNAKIIEEIPTVLVNGRYDMICPPGNAYRLHKLLPKSELQIIEGAGHSLGEKGIERALLRAMRRFE